MRCKIGQVMVGLAVAAMPLALSIPAAHADGGNSLLASVNSLRSSHGAAALAVDPLLTSVAQQWSAHMASAGTLSHNPNLSAAVPAGWTRLGENVGTGGSLAAVFNALQASPPHLANMVDPSFNLTGVAVVSAGNGALWVTEDFETRAGANPVPAPPPPPAATQPPVAPQPPPVAPHPQPVAPQPQPQHQPATNPVPKLAPLATANPAATTLGPPAAGAVNAPAARPGLPKTPPISSERSGHPLKSVASIRPAGRGDRSGRLAAGAGTALLSLMALVAVTPAGPALFGRLPGRQ